MTRKKLTPAKSGYTPAEEAYISARTAQDPTFPERLKAQQEAQKEALRLKAENARQLKNDQVAPARLERKLLAQREAQYWNGADPEWRDRMTAARQK
jgi:hypothetical protein